MILVTGARGFIGSALRKRLVNLGYKICEINSENGGVINPEVFAGLTSQDITHVFHLAAKIFIPKSWELPDLFFMTNVAGTQNVLEFCRKKGIALTYVSSYLYGQPEHLPIDENSPIRPNNPYAQSKYMAEQLCSFYAREFGVQVTILRPFNVYGIGQDKNFLIPSIIYQALHEEAIHVKTLSPKRDYIYLDDILEALICAMNFKNNKGSIFNIGSGFSVRVQEVVGIVQEIVGTDKPVVSEETTRKGEIQDVIADISKSSTELNWHPGFSFYDGIRQIVSYEKNRIRSEN